ncbi:MAG TPA: ABC transporter permease [Vicinamibacterales bacterium]|nr:ABC transporter permease [Vicinamibacterales bacterium]
MTGVVSARARRIYAWLLRRHGSARAGYADQMLATFDALLAQAETKGTTAVLRLLVREAAGILRTSQPGAASRPQQGRRSSMNQIAQDIRFAMRTFRRRPAFAAALVATLALGIGANAAIFSVTNAVLLQRLPFADPERLVMVWENAAHVGFPRNTPAPGNYTDWTTSISSFEHVGAISHSEFNLVGDGEPEKIDAALATASLWSALGVAPQLGRVWSADEDRPGHRIVVIGHGLWTRRFGADPSIVGRTLELSGNPYTIVGVMPPRFEFPSPDVEIWSPLSFSAARATDRGSHFLTVVARLRAGTTLEQANAELAALAARLEAEHPETNRRLGMYAVPLVDDYVGDTRTALIVLLGAVACVLLIACVNVANLLLTQASTRAREMAVRSALGADRRRLVRQLLTESLLLAFAGGVLGIVVATQTFPMLTLLVPRALSGLSRVTLDWRVVSVTMLLTAVTGIVFGLAPAWRASRIEHGMASTQHFGRGVVGGGSRLRHTLVVAQIALATALLIGAGLFVRSLQSATAVPLGFTPAQVTTVRLQLPRTAYADPARRAQFVEDVLTRVRALPGVTAAGFTGGLPLTWRGGTSGFIPELMTPDPSLPYDANNRVISPGYMEAMGYVLRRGRTFDARDTASSEPVGLINETMARQYWPGQDPLGRRFRLASRDAVWRTIVGIVADTRTMGIESPTRAEMYFPVAQAAENWMWPRDLAVKAQGDTATIVRAVSAAVWAVNPQQPISNVETMDEIVGRELQDRRLQTTLLATFAGLALFLAAVGIYGVLACAVTERTTEIGVRLALGGNPRRIRALFLRTGAMLTATGLALGLAISFWGTSLFNALLFDVDARDARTFVTQALVLSLVCLVAVYLPARRASRIDPVRLLRNE